jgi:hypothetical protein
MSSGFVHSGDDSNKEIQPDPIAFLQSRSDCLGANARDAYVALRVVDEVIVHVVGELAVNADRLELVKNGLA